MADDDLEITADVRVPRAELDYRATRSGGPGGQHVNTSSTRVELTWNVRTTTSMNDEQKERVEQKLANRIDSDGILHMSSSTSRSQHQNREEVTERFRDLIARALHVAKPRKRTKPTRASKEARLSEKKRRSNVKKDRGAVGPDE